MESDFTRIREGEVEVGSDLPVYSIAAAVAAALPPVVGAVRSEDVVTSVEKMDDIPSRVRVEAGDPGAPAGVDAVKVPVYPVLRRRVGETDVNEVVRHPAGAFFKGELSLIDALLIWGTLFHDTIEERWTYMGIAVKEAAAIAAVPRLAGCEFAEVHACSSWWTGLVSQTSAGRYEFTVGNVGETGAPMFRTLVGNGRVEPKGRNALEVQCERGRVEVPILPER